MNNLIVYCHGLNSSPASDKVERLKKLFPDDEVVCFQASIDPDKAVAEVGDMVLDKLIEHRHLHSLGKLYFVGTSLGGWLAAKLAEKFDSKALLINPCYDPQMSLQKYPEIDKEIIERYTQFDVKNQDFLYAIDPYDEVINMHGLMSNYLIRKYTFPHVGHRFNGPEFEEAATLFDNTFNIRK